MTIYLSIIIADLLLCSDNGPIEFETLRNIVVRESEKAEENLVTRLLHFVVVNFCDVYLAVVFFRPH